MKPFVLMGLGIMGVAVFVPSFVPEHEGSSEPSNIIRSDHAPLGIVNLDGDKLSRDANRKRRRCRGNGDLAPSNCGHSARDRSQKVALAPAVSAPKSSGSYSATIERDASGHFKTIARMNGRRIPVLVDTGATSVAISMATARRLGIRVERDDFKHSVSTANGKIKAAQAVIKEVRVGRISVRDVDALVIDGNVLSETLLGMAFLNKLSRYSVENGELQLTQ